MRTIRKIILHHTASPETTTAAEIDAWHRARGWRCIGYHYVIRRLFAGGPWTIEAGRPEGEVGAHDQGENADSIGVAVAGDYSTTLEPDGAAERVFAALCLNIRGRYGWIPAEGHRHNGDATACPASLDAWTDDVPF